MFTCMKVCASRKLTACCSSSSCRLWTSSRIRSCNLLIPSCNWIVCACTISNLLHVSFLTSHYGT